VSQLSTKCGSLDVSKTYRTPKPVTGIALPSPYILQVLSPVYMVVIIKCAFSFIGAVHYILSLK
jgi:hypothetical protein